MNRFINLVMALVAYVMAADVVRGAHVVTTLDEMITRVDSMSFQDLVTRTAGEIAPQKIGKYGGDFEQYWRNARVNFEGKTFEAIVADTTNARNRATQEAARLIPNATLGNHTAPADLLHVNPTGGSVVNPVQAKLGAGGVMEALGDPKYRGMDIVTCRESLDDLVARPKVEMAKALRRGLPLSPEYQRLTDAIESGRVWQKLPCGAPLPERSYVEAVTRSHYLDQWTATAGKMAATTDDTGRAVAATDDVLKGATGTTTAGRPRVSSVAKEVAAKACGAADDVATTLGKTVVRCAGPVATVYEVGYRGFRVYSTEAEFASGKISQNKREVEHAGNVGGAAGGVGGATGGAYTGAAVGTMICPGLGTAAGGVLGAVGGAIGGSYVGEKVAEAAMDAVHSTGKTVRGGARWTGKRLYRAYRWASPW